jgi:hypothetical protein
MPTLLLLSLVGSLAQEGAPSEPAGWRFVVEPYLWVPSLAGEGETDTTPSVEVDIVGEFDAALPLSFRADAPDGAYSLRLDGLYARWRDADGSLQTETEVWLVEGGVGVPVADHLEVTAGLRLVGLGFDAEVGPFEGSERSSFVDPWIGARSDLPLGGEWSLHLVGDVGGFGVGSDLSWQGLAFVGWRPGESWRIDLGYRAIGIDFEDSGLSYDLVAHGPVLGVGWGF